MKRMKKVCRPVHNQYMGVAISPETLPPALYKIWSTVKPMKAATHF